MKRGFLFEPDRCTGCEACTLACSIENRLPWGTSWRQVLTFNERKLTGLPVIHLSLACNHCENAPCISACPALALYRDAPTGVVLLDDQACIGCRYCAWACPYDAMLFDGAVGMMTKCNFCRERHVDGLDPACVIACPTGALGDGPVAELGQATSMPGFPETDARPSIRFVPPRSIEPIDTQSGIDGRDGCVAPPRDGRIGLRGEWPLAGFTLIAAVLVAWQPIAHPLAFLTTALAGMGLGLLHLGRKRRAWRAVFNVRRSWLSREIVTFSAFVALAAAGFAVDPTPAPLALATVLVGLLALFCIDRVYDVVIRRKPLPLHSADTVITAPYLMAVLAGQAATAGVLGLVKLVLYLGRAITRREYAWAAPRLVAGVLVPALLWWVQPTGWQLWAFGSAVLGEAIDRCQFYVELQPESPRRRIASELAWTRRTACADHSAPASRSAASSG